MLKEQLQKLMRHHDKIKQHKQLRIFGHLHLEPCLWRLHRIAVARAFAVGLFTAFLPIPFQMVVAAGLAILFRANLPISVVLVWLSNPVTIPPILYLAYKLGSYLLLLAPQAISTELSWSTQIKQLSSLWPPIMVGLFIFASGSALAGYLLIHWSWRLHIAMKWRNRQKQRLSCS